jgi:hypothetical protein
LVAVPAFGANLSNFNLPFPVGDFPRIDHVANQDKKGII